MPILTEAEKLQLCLERDRLLCSTEFGRSPTMSKLLRFLVGHKLLEDSTPLTAYAVAVNGLGRDDSFDTQIDSYPRVQIGRLRRMLDHFYLRENGENRLFIPYQHYEIILGTNEGDIDPENLPVDPERPRRDSANSSIASDMAIRRFASRVQPIGRIYILAILAVFMLLAIGTVYYLQKTDTDTDTATAIAHPSVIVKGPEGIINSSSDDTSKTIHSHLVGSLEKFDQLRVFDEDADPINTSQYYLETTTLSNENDYVQLRLVDSATREVIWSSRIKTTTRQERKADLNQAVIDIAGPYGKIAQHELSKYRFDYTPGYPCLLQFHQYMRYPDPGLLEPVLRCMDASAQQFPKDAYLISMLAIAKNISVQLGPVDKFTHPQSD